jgi:hypothetical protein
MVLGHFADIVMNLRRSNKLCQLILRNTRKKLDGTNHALVAAVKNSKNAAVQIGKTIGDLCFNVVRLQFRFADLTGGRVNDTIGVRK